MLSPLVILIIAILAAVLTWYFRRNVWDAIALGVIVFWILAAFSIGAVGRNLFQNGKLNLPALQDAHLQQQLGSYAWLGILLSIGIIYLFLWALWKIFWRPAM